MRTSDPAPGHFAFRCWSALDARPNIHMACDFLKLAGSAALFASQNTLAQFVRVIHADLRQLDYPFCDGFVVKIGTVGKSECLPGHFERETQ